MNRKVCILICLVLVLTLLCTACFSGGTGSADQDDSGSTRDEVYDDIFGEPEVSVSAEVTVLPEPLDGGVYTFFNAAAGCYLGADGNTLTLGSTPQNWTLQHNGINGFHVYADDSDLMLDIDNAHIAEGTSVKLWTATGYDAQVWNPNGNANGTYTFVSAADSGYCLGFDGVNAVLQLRDETNALQEWTAVRIDQEPLEYLLIYSVGGVIELRMAQDITNVISAERLQQWANDLEMAYYSYYDLTGFIPYSTIIVEAYKPVDGYFAYVLPGSNVIRVDSGHIYDDLAKMAVREGDWNFALLHEMGHMFDRAAWKFEAEVLTDMKIPYVLEMNGAGAAPAEYDAYTCFYGMEVMDAYAGLGAGFAQNYDVYSIALRFMEIKEDIGWEPFRQTFRALGDTYGDTPGGTQAEVFERFVSSLSECSGRDVRSYFSADEWNTIVNHLNG